MVMQKNIMWLICTHLKKHADQVIINPFTVPDKKHTFSRTGNVSEVLVFKTIKTFSNFTVPLENRIPYGIFTIQVILSSNMTDWGQNQTKLISK